MPEILTVYYSLKGQTIAPGMKIVDLEKGHTAVAAEFIQKAVGGVAGMEAARVAKLRGHDVTSPVCWAAI